MSKIDVLLKNYEKTISIPWRDLAAAQRVIFAVYQESDERRLKAKITEFELATRNLNHGWVEFNLTDTFSEWMHSQRYAKSYYKNPKLLHELKKNVLTTHLTSWDETAGKLDMIYRSICNA